MAVEADLGCKVSGLLSWFVAPSHVRPNLPINANRVNSRLRRRRERVAKREPPKPKGSSVPRAMVADECVSAEAVVAYARLMYRCGQAEFLLTLTEIGAEIGCRSRRASALLAELEQAGYLGKRPGAPPVRRLVVADQWAKIPPALLNLDVPPLALRVYAAIRARCRPRRAASRK